MNISEPTFDVDFEASTTLEEVNLDELVDLDGGPTLFGEALESFEDSDGVGYAAIPKLPIIPVAKRPVSGRYKGTSGAFQIELRVDTDRTRPMKRLSGDFYQTTGGTTKYYGSFIVNSPIITLTATEAIIKGLGIFTFAAGAPVVQVKIARRTILQPQAPATLHFLTSGGGAGASYACAFQSVYFRTVKIETDRVSNVATPVFGSYNTGSLPSGGAARNLSVVKAFSEAGIEMVPTAGNNTINVTEAGAGAKWSNAELHASMQKHFTLWKNTEQWAVWQLVAQLHDNGSGLYGIMFDQAGKQRQGCAVFHAGIGGTTNDKLRLQLYTYVHELGHCFNLLHSWQKSLATPPKPNRPDSLSFMNYPWGYPDGADMFWKKFAFQFDNEEVVHLRHAFRSDIVMGGKNFAVGSSLDNSVMDDPIKDESGLTLNISTHLESFALGEPVVLQFELGTINPNGKEVHTWLHPNCGLVKVAIIKPNGMSALYEPLIEHLVGEREAVIYPNDALKESAYIGFGKDGLYFDQPGRYQIRASYTAIDGSEVMSNVVNVRVRYPVTAVDDELADLFMGEEQGTLFYLLGSDNEFLKNGSAALDKVLEKHSKHPLANYVRLIKGVNAGRDFKTVVGSKEKSIYVRPAKLDESANLLSAVANSGVLDTITTQMTFATLADVQSKAGDEQGAKKSMNALTALKSGKA